MQLKLQAQQILAAVGVPYRSRGAKQAAQLAYIRAINGQLSIDIIDKEQKTLATSQLKLDNDKLTNVQSLEVETGTPHQLRIRCDKRPVLYLQFTDAENTDNNIRK